MKVVEIHDHVSFAFFALRAGLGTCKLGLTHVISDAPAIIPRNADLEYSKDKKISKDIYVL